MNIARTWPVTAAWAVILALTAGEAHAYIGPGAGFALGGSMLVLLVTFALALVILNVATAKATEGNSYYGLAIGFTVLAGAYAVGPVSGGAFNPAVGIGPSIVAVLAGDGSMGNLWFYIVGPLAGASLAVPVFRMQNPEGSEG